MCPPVFLTLYPKHVPMHAGLTLGCWSNSASRQTHKLINNPHEQACACPLCASVSPDIGKGRMARFQIPVLSVFPLY